MYVGLGRNVEPKSSRSHDFQNHENERNNCTCSCSCSNIARRRDNVTRHQESGIHKDNEVEQTAGSGGSPVSKNVR